MANERLDENNTEFPMGNVPGPPEGQGRFYAFFNKFFNRRGKGRPSAHPRLGGDAQDVKSGDVLEYPGTGDAGVSVSKGIVKLPKVEQTRRRKYAQYEKMDDYPEIGAALDIYADDATLLNEENSAFIIETNDQLVKDALEDFFKVTKLEEMIWDITRNVCKYGDCFIENILDLNNPTAGIQRVKILNPFYVFRQEDQYGYLKKFIQEIPKSASDYGYDGPVGGAGSLGNPGSRKVDLDKSQIVHFRRRTSDQGFYPYGKALLSPAIGAWNGLKMMEDAMIIYRLQRAPERRAFYIETGNIPSSKVEVFMERVKQKFKKEKFWNPGTQSIDERYNPLSADEDFFIPTRNGQGTKVETMPGAQNLGEVDDVRYFRDKLLAALKVPKDFIVEKDTAPERKANLSQLDVKFAKAVMRVQRDVEAGLMRLCRRHLKLRNFPTTMLKNFAIRLYPPSDMFLKRRLETDEARVRIVQAVKGLQMFPNDYIYRVYFNLPEDEIAKIKEQLKKEVEEQQAAAPPMMGGDPAMMGGDPAMMGGDPAMMGGDPAMMGGDPAMMGGNPMQPPEQPPQ